MTRTRDDLYLNKGAGNRVFLERFISPASIEMPSKTIICEYCTQGIRKDRLALHVKAKHIKELAAQFLQDANEHLFNPIQSLMKGYNPKNIPIYSKADNKALFYFGVVPRYFEDADSFGDYINNDNNMIAHKAFLEEIVKTISVQDYYKATGKVLTQVLTPLEELQAAVDSMRETIRRKDTEITVLQGQLKQTVEAFKAGGRYNVIDFTKVF